MRRRSLAALTVILGTLGFGCAHYAEYHPNCEALADCPRLSCHCPLECIEVCEYDVDGDCDFYLDEGAEDVELEEDEEGFPLGPNDVPPDQQQSAPELEAEAPPP